MEKEKEWEKKSVMMMFTHDMKPGGEVGMQWKREDTNKIPVKASA